MRAYVTNADRTVDGESRCILVCDAKKTQDGVTVPRESVCITGVDFEKRYQNTIGAECVEAYAAVLFDGNVTAYRHVGVFASDEAAIRATVTRRGLEVTDIRNI